MTYTVSSSAISLPGGLGDAARAWLQLAPVQELLINGERTPAADGRTFVTVDPSSGSPVAEVSHAGPADVDRAVQAARAALESGPWPAMSTSDRGAAIQRLADALADSAQQMAELESLENGKPVKLALGVDVSLSVLHLRYFGCSRHRCGQGDGEIRRLSGSVAA